MAIDDARLHLLAHSPHRGEVDPARAESILRRQVPRELVDHVYTCRDDATGRYLVTPRPGLGLTDARIGCPILHQGSLLGFVWLLGSEGPTDGAHLAAAEQAAAQAAILIHREHLRAGSAREHLTDLVDRLLGDDDSARTSAAGTIRAESLFTATTYAVIAAEIERPDDRPTEQDQLALASGLAAIRSRRLPQDLLTLERPGLALLVIAEPPGPTSRAELLALGGALRAAVLSSTDAANCRVGLSRSRDDLADAGVAANEARRAVRVARRVGTVDDVTAVETLGVYELLDQVPDAALAVMIHPGLRDLITQGAKSDSLVQTLEVFLDNAGDVRAASEQLFAHRTSLYYRLRRIQELTGLDLSNGDDRFIAHLGLRIARLTGVHRHAG
ncbi:PucR family transcriptional regulator [Dactylosporangium sp. CA-092794]|uniref:PucR family transcriptional regulator n=1 Tax=Dactylosporangium sp. CA-092794 TaxID=3239929 RepID=UPI003D8AABD7